jgi:urea ABC transporter substrate-binding protein
MTSRKRNGMIRRGIAAAAAGAAFFAITMNSGVAEDGSIKICVIDDNSGDFATVVKPKTLGYRLAIEEINRAGGVLGRKLEMVFYDGQSDVRRHQEMTQKCILDDKVDVVMAGATSSEREASRAIAIENKVIYWHNNQGEGGIADRYSFFTGPIPEQQILPGIEYMIKKFGPKMYILAADYGFGQLSAQWTHVAAGLYGGKIVGEEFIPLGNSEFASTIANIQKAKPDFGVFFLAGDAQSSYYGQALSAGATIPAVSTVNIAQSFEHKRYAPPALAKMYVPYAFLEETPSDSAKKFVAAARKLEPNEPYISEMTRCSYIAVNMMALAWKRAGTTKTEEVIGALQSGLSFDAPEGKVFLDPATHHLTMHIRIGYVNEKHEILLADDIGPVEPWWLRSLGVNLVRHDDAKQYQPADDPSYAKFLKK